MLEQEIVDYILQAQKHGLADLEIKQNLLNVGWDAEVVEHSFSYAKAADNKPLNSKDEALMQKTQISPSSKVQGISQPQVHSAQNQNLQNSSPPISQPSEAPVLTNQTSVNISDTQFASGATKPMLFKRWSFWLALIILLALAGGAYGYYTYFYFTPDRIWNNYMGAAKAKIYKTNFNLSYSYQDTNATSTGPITYSASGSLYVDLADSSNPQSSNDITLSANSSAGSFSLNLKYLLINKVIYVYAGGFSQLLGNQVPSWLKLDLSALDDYLKQNDSAAYKQYQDTLGANQAIENQLKQIWTKAKIINSTKFLAREQVGGVAVYHLKNQIDNQALATAVADSLDVIASQPSNKISKLTDQQKSLLAAVIKKFQVKEFDVWIGQKDFQLYKTHISLSAPSAADFLDPSFAALTPLGSAQAKSRDAKRLADARQLASALELYYNEHQGYPSAGADGIPHDLMPTYIGVYPSSPKPADGKCTDYYNNYYYYIPKGEAHKINGVSVYPSYTVTFCLGGVTGGYSAGLSQLTPAGIESNITCPSTPEKCVNNNPQSPDYQSALDKLNFTAQITFDSSFSDFGKVQNLQAPEGAYDVLDFMKNLLPATSSLFNSTSTSSSFGG